MILKKVKARNFFSIGNEFLEIDIQKYQQSILTGKNGYGKSSILNMITFALFGKTIKQVTRPQIVNSINNKNCLVEIELSSNGKNYLIKRGIKPNIFEIYEDSVLLDQSAVLDYQTFLEDVILGCSYRTFLQTSVISIENYTPFMSLAKSARRDFIEDILDIKVFTVMNQLVKANVTKNKDELKLLDVKLKNIKDKIILQKSHITNLEDMISAGIGNIVNKQNEYVEEISRNKDSLVEFAKVKIELDTELADLQELGRKRDAVSTMIVDINSQIRTVEKETTFFTDHAECPTCLQCIDSANSGDIITKNNKLSLELNTMLLQLKESKSEYEYLDTKIKTVSGLISANVSNINFANSTIRRLGQLVTDLDLEKSKLSEASDLSTHKKDLKESAKEAIDLKTRQTELNEEQEYNSIMLELFKDSGVKSKIVDQYLPVINKLVNSYLEKLDFFVSFNLDSEFSETIKSRHRDSFTYNSFSMGQKQRIDMALMFTFRQLATMRNSFSCNFLGMDEICDASIDSDGIDLLMAIFDSDEFASTNLMVISHANKDRFMDKFDGAYEFYMRDNFTQITESVL
jgi:DNA repair exonuclease SbcCD ATPase subunit